MLATTPSPRPLSARFTLVVLGTVLSSVGLIVVFAVWAAAAVDEEALHRQTVFVRNGLVELYERLPREQESAVVWDEAIVRTRAGDQAWMQENLGEWMGSYFGHDADYVLDHNDVPVHVMEQLQTLPPAAFDNDRSALQPLIDELRAEMALASEGLSDSTEAIAELSASDFVMLHGIPTAVSVKPIIPSIELTQAPGSEYLHIAVRRVSETALAEIADQYEINGLELLPADVDPAAAVPVTDHAGQVLGYLSWEGDRPGLRMVTNVAPGIVAAIAIGLTLLGWLVGRLRRSSTQLQASEAQAHYLAFHDVLTRLPNRALFEDRLERALATARRSGQLVALHAIDIDRFKNINDTLGHPAGDELIRQVAARLSSAVRETDTVARLGGDEFVVVQTEIGSDADAEELARRLIGLLSDTFDLKGEKAVASASIGIVVSSSATTSPEEMLRKADIALYEAKGRGRARFESFAGDMDDLVKRRRQIEGELRLAIEMERELKVIYQPLFTASGNRIVGAEALVRWDHPVHGRLPPDLFINIAEERALIEPLGEWVLRQAALFAVQAELPWIAVNVSPVQFRNDRFPDRVFAILEAAGLAPNRLQLEITEGALLENTGVTEHALGKLRERGVRIALDDFGTGYSSMSYLRRYAVDKLKIDRSFVAQLGTTTDADAIIRAMVTLARALRLEVTAEGVETVEQRDHLAAIGCNEFQGYLLSKPVSGDELRDLLGSASRRPTAHIA